ATTVLRLTDSYGTRPGVRPRNTPREPAVATRERMPATSSNVDSESRTRQDQLPERCRRYLDQSAHANDRRRPCIRLDQRVGESSTDTKDFGCLANSQHRRRRVVLGC